MRVGQFPFSTWVFRWRAVIRISIGYWLLQFEITVLPHLHWSQLGSSSLHINQSLPKSMLHVEPNTYISSVRIRFFSLFLHIQYTHNPGYNNKDKKITRDWIVSNNHFPSSSPVWIPGFQQQMFINPNSLISLSYLMGSFQFMHLQICFPMQDKSKRSSNYFNMIRRSSKSTLLLPKNLHEKTELSGLTA